MSIQYVLAEILYLSDVNPVAYDEVCGLWLFLCPLQVVGIVVSFQNPDWVWCVKVKLSIVGFCCSVERTKVIDK